MPKQNVRKPTKQWLAHVARGERAARRTKMRAAVAELTATWCKHALISASASASPMAKLGPQRFAAIGAAPDLASRLCDEAKDAQILIDAKVRAAVELMCELDPLAELRLKVSPDYTPECVFG